MGRNFYYSFFVGVILQICAMSLFFVDRDILTEAELMFETQFGGWLIVMCYYYFGIHLLMDYIWT